MPTSYYLILSLLLFGIGMAGMLIRRNIIILLMCIELMFNAANINFVAYGTQWAQLMGQVFPIFIITIAAGEVAIGLALLIALYRNATTIDITECNILKW